MHPRMLARDTGCTGGTCPAVYDLDELPGRLVVQGKQAGSDLLGTLTGLASDESAVIIGRDTVLDALRPQDEPTELAELQGQFTSFSYSAFRLEQYQDYNGTGPDPSWATLVRASRKWGKVHQRVRVAKDPMTPATVEELTEGYPGSVAAGEDISVIPVTSEWPAGVLRDDYWLFDSSRLYVLLYQPDDHLLAGVLRVTDPERILSACRARDAALHHATPWRAFIASRPELKRRVAQ